MKKGVGLLKKGQHVTRGKTRLGQNHRTREIMTASVRQRERANKAQQN